MIRLWQRLQSYPPLVRACLVSAMLVAVIFADVLLRGNSMSNLENTLQAGMPNARKRIHMLWPERKGRQPVHGLSDSGGAAWQSEPGQQFMRRCLFGLESPFWNPYSAAGSLGPETLVDIKFSPFTLMVALAGGSTFAFHAIALGLYVAAATLLIRLLVVHFRVSEATAVASAAVYLLNGYFVANLNSNVNQTYLYYPACLYALLNFTARPSVLRFLVVTATNVLLLATTFMPTTSLLTACIYTTAGFHALFHGGGVRRGLAIIAAQAASLAAAAGLLAFLYLPIVSSFEFLGTFEMYEARIFYPASWKTLISFFTPKHFWESYTAIRPQLLGYIENVVFHCGIASSLILAQGLFLRRHWNNALTAVPTLILIVSLGRVFAVPGIKQLVELLPFFRNVGEQYWFTAIAFAFPLVFASGCQAVFGGDVKLRRSAPVALVVLGCLAFLGVEWARGVPGFPVKDETTYLQPFVAVFYVAVTIGVVVGTLNLLRRFRALPTSRLRLICLLLILGEMIFYMNNKKFERRDFQADPPEHIAFLRREAGIDRVLNYGIHGLYPEIGSAFGIQELGSMNMNIIPSYYKFYERNFLSEHNRWGLFAAQVDIVEPPRLVKPMLDMMAVRYLVVSKYMLNNLKFFDDAKYPKVAESDTAVVYENRDRYPRAFATRTVMKSDLTPDTKNYSARDVVFTLDEQLLEAARAVQIPVDSASAAAASVAARDDVEVSAYHNCEVRLKAMLTQPSVVVLTDCWHPAWTATADGRDVYIGKVNESFRGVALPAGEHEIVFRYFPRPLRDGLAITSGAAAVLLLLFLARRPIDRWTGAASPPG